MATLVHRSKEAIGKLKNRGIEKMKVIITIDKNLCKGCGICLSGCSKNVFALSKERNSYGSPMPEAIQQNECIICRLCEKLCPDAAINVEEEGK